MRPIFCGNFEYDTRQSELERLFGRYGRVERVDMKSGFAFVYMDDERDARDAIHHLHNSEFGRQRRRLSVEWASAVRPVRSSTITPILKQPEFFSSLNLTTEVLPSFRYSTIIQNIHRCQNLPIITCSLSDSNKITCLGDRGVRRDGVRPASTKPTKTLFVINFDPFITKVRDLEKHFEPYGKLSHVRIRRNFAFVQFETQEEATKAIECTHMSKLLDRVIAVEYAIRDDDERDAPRDSPGRRGYGRRGSPAYGRSVSPGYGRSARRPSPDYGRGVSPYGRPARRPSPDYGRGPSPIRDRYRAPVNDHHRSPVYDDRHRSPVFVGRHRSPVFDRYRSRSPRRSRT